MRTFTNLEGKTMQARVLSYENGQVKIQRADGATFTLSADTLTEPDRNFLGEWKRLSALKPAIGSTASPGMSANAKVSPSEINQALGQTIFEGEGPLWQQKAEDVAARLKWRRESQTPTLSSFRKYPGENERFAGARPYSAALYGENGKTANLSLVYANKGDFFGAKGSGEQHFDKDKPPPDALSSLKAAIKADADAIAKALGKVLGAPQKQNYGEGESRRPVQRWDWLGHAFILSEEPEQYAALAIVPSDFADQRGKTARVSDASVRERIRASVERRPNGDVVVGSIPMVDQGPKGYCAPATCERAMRHVGMAADMYLLAVAGGTGLGGGVAVERMLDTVGRDIRRKGRSFETFNGSLNMRKITRFLDAGLPVLWRMDSVKAFNDVANRRTKARKSVTDWAEWKKQIASDEAKIVSDDSALHCTLIIGYNAETGEVAFSDSWGENYTERWVRVEEAEAVSNGGFYVIGL